MKVLDLLNQYREYLSDERQLAKDTLRAYTTDLRGLSSWWKGDLEAITKNDLREYMRHLHKSGQARATVRRKLQGFATFFQWAAMEGHMETCPTDGLVVPSRKKAAARFLSVKELETFVNTAPPIYHMGNQDRDRLAFRLLAWTGIRRGELLNLKVGDVRIDDKLLIIREPKSGQDRELPIPEKLVPDLQAIIAGRQDGWLLLSMTGNAWGYGSFSAAFRRHARQCGFGADVTPHTLRHTFGTHLAAAGVPLTTISNLMGHKEIKTTMQYIHHTPAMRKAAMDLHPLAQGA